MSEDIQNVNDNLEQHQNADIESSYKMLTDREHVLLRPAMYIGPVVEETHNTQSCYFDENSKMHIKRQSQLSYSKGTITLFNELVNNSYDEYIRTKHLSKTKRLNQIDIVINVADGVLEVKDNGGIPVVHHKGHDMMLPTMLFGHLRSGSNYDDTKRGKVSGVNGVGASLVNVMSKSFVVNTSDGHNWFTQEWTDNMLNAKEHNISKSSGKGFTQIIAKLDFERLGMQGFTNDLINKLILRAAEVAAMGADARNPLSVSISIVNRIDFEDAKYNFCFNHFWEFTKLYDDIEHNFWGESYENVAFEFGPSSSDSFESIALVNSIRCDYGTHVNALADWAALYIREFLNRKHKIDLKPQNIKDRMCILSRWSIDAPSFNNQTKDELVTNIKDFGFMPEMSMKFKQSLEKSEIVLKLIDYYQQKQQAEENEAIRKQQKQTIKPTQIQKLVDATSKNREDCVLFIAEGDSAMNGLRKCRTASIHGAFSLGGKFINSLSRTPAQLLKVKNKMNDKKDSDAKHLCDAIGLVFNQKAENLRYGKIYIMTDADNDGYCIAAQLVLFLRKHWPELFDEGRVYLVESPLVIAKLKNDTRFYYSNDEFLVDEEFLLKNKYSIRYIKGLAAIEPNDYKNVVKEPKLIRLLNDSEAWDTLVAWFNADAEGRKQLVNS
jgi:DNA topoisomerase-2